jgi:hypothetical protein
MKNRVQLLLALLILLFVNPLWSQDYQTRMTNFAQVSESEFQFDIQIRNARPDPQNTGAWAYNSAQYQIVINTAIANGGQIQTSYLTVDNSETDLPPNQQLEDGDFFYAGPNMALATNSPSMQYGSELMFMNNGEWRTISRFIVKLRNAAGDGFNNWADIDPGFVFLLDQTIVFSVPFDVVSGKAYRQTGSSVSVLNKTASDLIIDVPDRQLAGYWFSGNGIWADAARWNNVTTENMNTLPGANSNAIINGNCTIAGAKAFYSLLPDGSGNGGELTILTGEEPLFTLTLVANGTGTQVTLYDESYNILANPTYDITAGTQFYFNTTGIPPSGNFINWTDQNANVVGTVAFYGPYTMPASDMVITANWTSGSKDTPTQEKESRDQLYASLTLAPGAELTVDKLFNENINGAPAVLVQSDETGTGSLIHNNDVEATIQRYIPASSGGNPMYHLVSVPLTQASDPRSGLFQWSYLFNFDVLTQEWVAMGTSLYNPLFVDQGYMIYKYPGPTKWETDTTYSFAGPINNGAFACNVAFPDEADNHNLVPNPYPSAIDWDATSGWTKTNVNNAIWIWNPTSANYASYINNVGANDGSRYIPVGQSFFVSASAAAPALSMTNDVRVHNDQAFLKNKEELPDLLRVKALANNFSDEAVVRFADAATAGFDGQYDASKFYGSPEAPQLFTMSSDDKQLSINTMEVGTGKRIVDLGFTLEAAGLCILNFSGIESFNSDMQIHLNDRVTGQTVNLRTTPEYSFAHSPENAALRFELIFDGVTAIADAKPVNQDFFYVDGKLYLNFPQDSQGPFNVTVYNINGQTEFLGVAHEARAVVDLAGLTSGFHIVRVVTNDYSGEKKVVVK